MKYKSFIFIACFITFGFMGCNHSKDKALTKIIKLDGELLEYYSEGKGIPCIVFTGSENLGPKMYSARLKKHLILIHADPKNIPPERIKSITIDSLVDDIERIRVKLGVKKIAVMGHSVFGLLPLEYALKYPRNASYAIVSGSAPFGFTEKFMLECDRFWKSDASAERKNIWEDNVKKLAANSTSRLTESEKFIRKYIADVPMRFYNPKYDMAAIWAGIELNMVFANHLFSLLNNYDHSENYQKIKIPILVVSGRYDYGSPYTLWDDIKDKISTLQYHLFKHAGHNPMLESREEFDQTIIEWLETHR